MALAGLRENIAASHQHVAPVRIEARKLLRGELWEYLLAAFFEKIAGHRYLYASVPIGIG